MHKRKSAHLDDQMAIRTPSRSCWNRVWKRSARTWALLLRVPTAVKSCVTEVG